MGADIHLYIERKRYDDYWQPFGGQINPGRDYRIFGVLAGVRSDGEPMFALRGLPEKMGYAADSDWWYYIVEDNENDAADGHARRSEAASWVKSGASVFRNDSSGKNTWVSDPDGHSASWLGCSEFAQCVQSVPDVDVNYRAVVAAMRAIEAEGHETRVVFWFDN